MKRPPRLARWLLARSVWPDDRDALVGDLGEQFQLRRARDGWGFATLWYWREALALAWGLQAFRMRQGGRMGTWMAIDDARYAVRRLVKRPVTTAVSVVTLAIAIGAGVAAWTLIDAVLLRPLPVREAERLVVVDDDHTFTRFTAIRDLGVFENVIGGGTLRGVLVEAPGREPAYRDVWFATHDFFDVLGLEPAAGRDFGPADDARDAEPAVLLSYRFWRDVLGAPASAIGSEIRVGPIVATVVGIAPRGYRGLSLASAPDLIMPLLTVAQLQRQGANHLADSGPQFDSPYAWIDVVGRLRAGVSVEQATAELQRLSNTPGFINREPALTLLEVAALPAASREAVAQFSRVLAVTVGLLLLIGSLTVGMLLLMRTDERRDELSMCLVLGARRARLGWGIALEGALMVAAGALLALPTALGMLTAVRGFELPGGVGIDLLDVGLDARAAGTAVATALAATAVITLVAAVLGSRVGSGVALRSCAGATPRLERRRLRTSLAVGQVAVAILLLAGAGLFVRSLMAGLALNPGIETARLVSATVSLPEGFPRERTQTFFDDLRRRVTEVPLVEAGATSAYAGGMTPRGVVHVNDEPRQFPSTVLTTAVDDHYFSTIGLSLLEGRDFAPTDREGTPNVAVVSESFARALAGDSSPLRTVVAAGSQDAVEIVGVVPDVVMSVQTLEPLVIYRPFAQVGGNVRTTLVMRTSEPEAAAEAAIATMRQLEPGIVPPVFMTIQDRLADQLGSMQFGARVLGALGAIALVLTLMSIYVIASSMAVQRRRELGIRAAMGATTGQLGRLVFVGSARLAVLGVGAGLLLVWQGTGLLRGLLFGVAAFDVTTVAFVSAGIVGLVLIVGLGPAVSASRVDLARVLRED